MELRPSGCRDDTVLRIVGAFARAPHYSLGHCLVEFRSVRPRTRAVFGDPMA